MKLYLDQTVLEAARERVRWVYREFPTVYVSFSGGKDSTVVLNLAIEAARELGRLPVPVVFLDQEAEWQHVIDYIRSVMDRPDVSSRWLQLPFRLFNATSTEEQWLRCWDPAKEVEWIRPKEPDSIKQNPYGTDRFHEMFGAFIKYHHPTKPAAYLAGVRGEESPARLAGLTNSETYKGVTWGKALDAKRKHYTFYPIYDWALGDVWKAIHEHGWVYATIYDLMYQRGVPIHKMRVSNLHHETSLACLFILQEMEPATWERVQSRLAGVNAAGQLAEHFYGPKELPSMFASWREYRDYILANLIPQAEQRAKFAQTFATMDARFAGTKAEASLTRTEIATILVNDIDLTKLKTWGVANFKHASGFGRRTMGGAYVDTGVNDG